ncbi:hypothetical protein ES703_17022 [subsurface metagenome]
MQEKRLHLHYFMPTYTLPLENRTFLTKISLFQKFKMAIYKGLVILEEQKYPKIRVVIADFLNFRVRLKALYVRFWGIPEGGLKAFKTKGLRK